jgi:hypothetical protein
MLRIRFRRTIAAMILALGASAGPGGTGQRQAYQPGMASPAPSLHHG